MKMKTMFLALLTTGWILLSGSLPASGQTAAEISKKSMDAIDLGSMEMDFTLTIRDHRGNERVRQITMASAKFGVINKSLIRFTAPADVNGTTLLIYDHEHKDDDMWIYMPALKKVRRIISSEKGKSFMGSEFTNADMSKPNQANFQYSILGTTEYEGVVCWKIESTGIDQSVQKANGYSKTISYIDTANYLCHKVEYYDLGGQLQRIQQITNYKEQSANTYFAYRMVMANVQTKRVSEMVVTHLQTGTALNENTFSPTALQ
ncbi:MAG: outer membrane lipoprotein-sorting protein [Bacteroidales bacterium]|jgi:outer membrane lipoprotein-sorting protein